MTPVVLDFDGSSGTVPDALVVALQSWQELIRFGCSLRSMRRLDTLLDTVMPENCGPVLLGSGDFHHVSHLLIRRVARCCRCRVVVMDNHPDNMRFPFGIHCGSWVSHVAALPNVTRVDVVGITSSDVSIGRLWENRWLPLLRGKVRYWCIGTDVRWARRFGLGSAFSVHPTANALIEAFLHSLQPAQPTYLSIDKDVLHPDVARTNWDQGALRETHLNAVISALTPHLAGMDITGDVSAHRYRTRWKRWLSAIDHQPEIPAAALDSWQRTQRAINARLLTHLASTEAHAEPAQCAAQVVRTQDRPATDCS